MDSEFIKLAADYEEAERVASDGDRLDVDAAADGAFDAKVWTRVAGDGDGALGHDSPSHRHMK